MSSSIPARLMTWALTASSSGLGALAMTAFVAVAGWPARALAVSRLDMRAGCG